MERTIKFNYNLSSEFESVKVDFKDLLKKKVNRNLTLIEKKKWF